MVNQGDANATEGMSKSGHTQATSDQALADYDSQVKLESVEKKRKGGGWRTTPFIFGCEAAEGLAGFGTRANLIIFLTQKMNLRLLNAVTLLNGVLALTTVASLGGAFVADAYLGRFTTIALGSWIYLAGLFTLTVVAWDKTLHPPECTTAHFYAGTCQKSTNLQLGILYLSFLLMALGSGLFRPCVAPFGASQFDQTHPEEKKQLKHYFIWFFFTASFAMLLASTVIVYIQVNVGFALGFGIPTIVFLLSIIFFFAGMFLYRYHPPRGSPFTRMAQVIVAAIRKRKLAVPEDPSSLYHSDSNVSGNESEELEKPGSDDDHDEASDETTPKVDRDHRIHDAKLSVSLSTNLPITGGGQLEKAKAGTYQPENVKVEKNIVDVSNAEKTVDENFDERENGYEKVYDKRNDAAQAHRLGNTPESNTVGPHRGEEEDGALVLNHCDQFRFFDKAAVPVAQDWSNSYGNDGHILKSKINPWRLSSVHQVEELKCMVRLAPMFATIIPLALSKTMEGTYGVQQATTMDRRIGHFVVPAASFSIFTTLTVLIWLPTYDKIVIPWLRRYTGKERGITFLQKIGVGMALAVLSHVVATLVEHERRQAAWHYGLGNKPKSIIPFSGFWLVPQHVINGLSDSFMMVGHFEFFYFMLPEYLTTTGAAVFLTATTIGASLSTALIHIVEKVTSRPGHSGWLNDNINKAHLDYFYALLTIIVALDLLVFLVVARWYTRQRHLNKLMVETS